MANRFTLTGAPATVNLNAPLAGAIRTAIINAHPGTTINITAPGADQIVTLRDLTKADPGIVVVAPPNQWLNFDPTDGSPNVHFEGGIWESSKLGNPLKGANVAYAIDATRASKFSIRGATFGASKNHMTLSNCFDVRLEKNLLNHCLQDFVTMKSTTRFSMQWNVIQEALKGYKTGIVASTGQILISESQNATAQAAGEPNKDSGKGVTWDWFDVPHNDGWQGTVSGGSIPENRDVIIKFNKITGEIQGIVVYDSSPAYAPILRGEISNNEITVTQTGALALAGTELLIEDNIVTTLVVPDGSIAGMEVRAVGGTNIRGGRNQVLGGGAISTFGGVTAALASNVTNGPSVSPAETPRIIDFAWRTQPVAPDAEAFPALPPEIIDPPLWLWVGKAAGTNPPPPAPGKWIVISRGMSKFYGKAALEWEHQYNFNGGAFVAGQKVQCVAGTYIGQTRVRTENGWSEWASTAPLVVT